MMRGTRGALAVTVAALLVCCSADSHQESENANEHTVERYDPGSSDIKHKEDFQDYLRFLLTYYNDFKEHNLDGSSDIIDSNGFAGRNVVGNDFSNMNQVKNFYDNTANRHWGNRIPSKFGRSNGERYVRFVDPLGGGNFVRRSDSAGDYFASNIDSNGILVKKNLDHIGGPNLVKRILDSIGGGHKLAEVDHPGGSFTRHVREAGQYRFVPYLMTRRFDYVSPYGGKRDPWAMSYGGYYGDGLPKRNFDEIDRSNLDTFLRKRNFDEIDQTSMPFPFAKRFYHQYGLNSFDLDLPISSFDKKRYRPDYPMDEIDLSQFPIGSKRSQNTMQPQH
ncbi:unnamed protein product [Diatraea saccharalis]|uniref:Orcokinin n=1 Tax=Diatraea saccharalis TaxID=40085 RepID=A0A9N9R005_9NEOP|nr:unnamed protein product [Diatraea saccharalis]